MFDCFSAPSFFLIIKRLCPILFVSFGFVFTGCHSIDTDDAATANKKAELTTLTVELFDVTPQLWPVIVRSQGSLIADEYSVVGTKVPGRVAEVLVDLGDEVKGDDPLVKLDQIEFRLQIKQVEAQLTQAYATVGLKPGDDPEKLDREKAPPARQSIALWDKAKADLVRTRELLAQNAITEVEAEQASTSEKVAEAQYASTLNNISEMIAAIQVRAAELAMAQQRLAETVVLAPFAGMVQQRHVAPGAYVQVGQAMITVVRTDPLRFRGTLPERYVRRLALGQEVRLRIESIDEPRVAKITRISPVVDELSRSLLFEAEVDNGDRRVRSGLFGEAEVVLDAEAEAIVVPLESVVEFAGVEKVWKVVAGKSQEQIVRTGQRRGSQVQIVEGLAAGDSILRDGKTGRIARVIPKHSTSSSGISAAGSALQAKGSGESDLQREDASQTHSTE